jgi:signal transduction histidine kinase
MPPFATPGSPELAAALLQAAVTAALAALSLHFFIRYRKPYFAWWAIAWGLYLLRVGAISSFLLSADFVWLFWHQVVTGWVALALLWAALVFGRQMRWRWSYVALIVFPPVWSYIAIYRLDHFLWAALPAVLFLSAATLWTGFVFLQYHRRVGSPGAAVLGAAFVLWSLHHLDYPFLRARGAWVPWGYYLDILFELAVGAGIALLVLDDLRRGLAALSALSADLQRGGGDSDVLDALLGRPLTLPAVRGTALYLVEPSAGFVRGAGVCADWTGTTPSGPAATLLHEAIAEGRPRTDVQWERTPARATPWPFAAVLPIFRRESAAGALVLVGDARDPFTALGDDFLLALGRQVGAALEQADLTRRLKDRTEELSRLSARMVAQHEEERRRLSRELHDETAQVLSAVKMELGVLRDSVGAADAARLDHTLSLVDTGIRGIRNVVNDLRPSLLDDLGLLPALRSMVSEFRERSGTAVTLTAPDRLPPLSKEAEVALFRALQEGLSNVARHSGAQAVTIALGVHDGAVRLDVADDGRGAPHADVGRFEREGHMGLAGMRERIHALGGAVTFGAHHGGAGSRLLITLPFGDGT